MTEAPASRIRTLNDAPINAEGDYVLYWMVATRRMTWSFALQRAAEHARELGRGIIVLEALRCDYPYASDRLHAFILEGMAENLERCETRPVTYFPYVEPERGAGRGLLAALAKRACVVVTDDYPAFFIPRMQAAAAEQLEVRLEAVDSCGLMPLGLAGKPFKRAVDFRRFVQKELRNQLDHMPVADPLGRASLPEPPSLPRAITKRWQPATEAELSREHVASLPIDHDVEVAELQGGRAAGQRRLRAFLQESLNRYDEDGNHPDAQATSGLSPYLHFGHLSPHQVFSELMEREEWTPASLSEDTPRGQREGWWGVSPAAEAFLDQLVTWRELGFGYCRYVTDADRYETLPEWSQTTLAEHEGDERPHLYQLEDFAAARTHDPLWNAAQRQLVREGQLHNYLRMLWGKKILEWSPDPRAALAVMLELNDRYALDGRDPNSLSGIFWVLGRFDRAWQERPIFGKVRYMTSESTRRKLRLRGYLERYGADKHQGSLFPTAGVPAAQD